jgi:hypothetical protein
MNKNQQGEQDNKPILPALEKAAPVDLPESFKQLEGKTGSELIQFFSPKLKNVHALAGVGSGMGFEVGTAVPEWARRASGKFYEAIGLKIQNPNEVDDFEMMGLVLGLVEADPKLATKDTSPAFKEFLNDFCNFAKSHAVNADPKQGKQFADARLESHERMLKIRQLPQRTKVYIVLSALWPIVQQFNSYAELHRFLLDMNIIVPTTDSSETRKVCREIGIPIEGKPGRPPNE